jgi:hypothetical protein
VFKVCLIFPHSTGSNNENTQNPSQCNKSEYNWTLGHLNMRDICAVTCKTLIQTLVKIMQLILSLVLTVPPRVLVETSEGNTSQTVCTYHLCSGLYQFDRAANTGGLKCHLLPCSSLTQRTADKRMEKVKGWNILLTLTQLFGHSLGQQIKTVRILGARE